MTFRVGFSDAELPASQPNGIGRTQLYADKQLMVARTGSPPGIKFAGEIDASNSHSVSSSIAAAMTLGNHLHVDVSQVMFCDISGIRALVSVAEGLPADRRLLLHGMPTALENVMRVVGWNRLPALVACECGSD